KTLPPFVEPHLKVDGTASGRVIEIRGAPFDVEDAVGRRTAEAGIDALGRAESAVSAQVGTESEDGVVKSRGGQTDIEIVGIGAAELEVAIGADAGGGEGLPVVSVGERKGDCGSDVVAVVADIGSAWDDGSARGLRDGIVGAARGDAEGRG